MLRFTNSKNSFDDMVYSFGTLMIQVSQIEYDRYIIQYDKYINKDNL